MFISARDNVTADIHTDSGIAGDSYLRLLQDILLEKAPSETQRAERGSLHSPRRHTHRAHRWPASPSAVSETFENHGNLPPNASHEGDLYILMQNPSHDAHHKLI